MSRREYLTGLVGLATLIVLLVPVDAAFANGARLGGGGALNLSLTRIVTSLLLCLGIAVAAILLIKRSGGRPNLQAIRTLFQGLPTQQRVKVIETRRISQHADLCLVRCDDIEYVILSSAHQQQVIRERPASEAIDA